MKPRRAQDGFNRDNNDNNKLGVLEALVGYNKDQDGKSEAANVPSPHTTQEQEDGELGGGEATETGLLWGFPLGQEHSQQTAS